MDPEAIKQLKDRIRERQEMKSDQLEAERLLKRKTFLVSFYQPRPSRIIRILIEEQVAASKPLAAE